MRLAKYWKDKKYTKADLTNLAAALLCSDEEDIKQEFEDLQDLPQDLMELFDDLLEDKGKSDYGFPMGAMIVIPHPTGNTILDKTFPITLAYLGKYIRKRRIKIHKKSDHPFFLVAEPSLAVEDGEG